MKCTYCKEKIKSKPVVTNEGAFCCDECRDHFLEDKEEDVYNEGTAAKIARDEMMNEEMSGW